MKMKIKLLIFLLISISVFNFSSIKVLAADDCTDVGGTCQMWCSGTDSENTKGSLYCDSVSYAQNTCCIPAAVNTNTTSSGNPCAGIEYNTSNWSSRSLLKCHCDQGICYDKKVGCPNGSNQELEDIGNTCGTSYKCCSGIPSSSCGGSDSVCVNKNVICLNENTTNGISCGSDQKCCYILKPGSNSTGASSNSATVKASSPVSYSSQCSSTNDNGAESNCTHDNDRAILANQCEALFNPTNCSSMNVYLNYLTSQCLRIKPAGIDCALISKGDSQGNAVFGKEAAKFANYYIQNNYNPAATSASSDQSAGGLGFDEIAAMGLPDAPGVKSILVNVLTWLLSIIGLITLIAFIISGGQYLLASGNDKMIETAKKNMTYSIIGIIVALSGFVIIRAIDAALQATSWIF
jgi:hypothetical protein